MEHTTEKLRELQSLSLEEKIQVSTARIIEWYEYWEGQVYISNSGGVDSTVLSWLVHNVYPDVVDVYCDTGLEYPELREFVLNKSNVIALKPKMSFVEVIKKYGYPLISKETAYAIYSANHGSLYGINKMKGLRTDGTPNSYYASNVKWEYLVGSDIPVGNQCCYVMKKSVAKHYEKQSGKHPFIGTMTEESTTRKTAWIRSGCNAFSGERPISSPISFWKKSDVLECLHKYNIPYVKEIYGDIVCENGVYTTTKLKRSGCIWCGLGCHLEKEPNKFQVLAELKPNLYDYCMRGGKYDESGKWIPDKGLGMAKVLDFINVKWWNDGDEELRDRYRKEYKEKEEKYYNNT